MQWSNWGWCQIVVWGVFKPGSLKVELKKCLWYETLHCSVKVLWALASSRGHRQTAGETISMKAAVSRMLCLCVLYTWCSAPPVSLHTSEHCRTNPQWKCTNEGLRWCNTFKDSIWCKIVTKMRAHCGTVKTYHVCFLYDSLLAKLNPTLRTWLIISVFGEDADIGQ